MSTAFGWSIRLLVFAGLCGVSGLTAGPAWGQETVAHLPGLSDDATQIAQGPGALPPDNDLIQQLVTRINQVRTGQGLAPLRINPKLNQVARAYSQVMADTGCFGHHCVQGATLKQRIAPTQMKTNLVAENLYLGPVGANLTKVAIAQWLQDMPHRCNILLPEVSETGIGITQQGQQAYITQIFVQPRTASHAPAPLSRVAFEAQFKRSSPAAAVQLFETLQTREFGQQLQTQLCGITSSTQQTAAKLAALSQFTGKRTAVAYVIVLKDELQVLVVPPARSSAHQAPTLVASADLNAVALASQPDPKVIRNVVPQVSRRELLAVAQKFRREVSDPSRVHSQSYRASAQKLYQWLIAPLEGQLKAHNIDTLLFSFDDGLRSIPVAALHDGQRFLVEQYNVALIPSFGLTHVRFSNLKNQSLLAVGISESTAGQSPLPSVTTEISLLKDHLWKGQTQATLNQRSTLGNFKAFHGQHQPGIIHLATHAKFERGHINNSFIQFWNGKLTLGQLRPLSRELRWGSNPAVQLLVLSACQTAIGSKEAELGFAGSAIAAGVPATLASLWSISDDGTLGIMSKFYQQLKLTTTKTEALRQAQLAMLSGKLRIHNGRLLLAKVGQIPLPPSLANGGNRDFVHPYFWAGYTVIGNWN